MKTGPSLLKDVMLLARAAQVILQEEIIEDYRAADLNPAKLNVLRLLKRRKRQSINDIARFLAYTKAAASQNVDRLVTSKLATRKTDTNDRRCTWVTLTAKGKGLVEKLEKKQEKVLGDSMKGISKSAAQTLSTAMRKLAFSLLDSSDTQPPTCIQCCAYGPGDCSAEGEGWGCYYTLQAAPEAPRKPERKAPGRRGRKSGKSRRR